MSYEQSTAHFRKCNDSLGHQKRKSNLKISYTRNKICFILTIIIF